MSLAIVQNEHWENVPNASPLDPEFTMTALATTELAGVVAEEAIVEERTLSVVTELGKRGGIEAAATRNGVAEPPDATDGDTAMRFHPVTRGTEVVDLHVTSG